MLARLTVRTKILGLLTSFMIGLLIECFLINHTVSEVRVHGPAYERIAVAKDLIADVLPPPGFIVQSFLLAHEQVEAPEAATRDRFAARIDALRQEFETRHAYWREHLDDPRMRQRFGVDSYAPAQRFFAAYQQVFMPALAAHDLNAARAALRGPLKTAFDEHEAQIVQVVALAHQTVKREETLADATASHGLIVSALGLLLMAAGTLIAAIFVLGSIEAPLMRVRELFKAMANRDLTQLMDLDAQGDSEFGEMTRLANAAVESMREVLRSMAEQSDSLAGASFVLRVVC
jgi:methyl-accepting chemotaxis protein